MLDDEKYKSLRKTLKSSPRIRAKNDFEARLFERIREAEKSGLHNDAFKQHPQVVNLTKPKKKFSEVLSGLFKPAFVPALGLTVVLLIAVVVYFGYFSKMNDKTENTMVSYDTKQGEFVIYVKSDAKDSFDYPKEYSAITEDERHSTDSRTINPVTESPGDFYAPEKPVPGVDRPVEKSIPKMDKLGEEQRIEMQKDFKDGIDLKGERKSDDVIMKKESKNEPKKKLEGKISNEKKNVYINEDDSEEMNQQVQPKSGVEDKDSGDTEKSKKDSSRISRAVTKDSSKTKNKADDENTIEQK